MSRLFLLLALLSALMGSFGIATWLMLASGGCVAGWLLFGPGGRWL